jgi:hypothetical protein
MALAMDKGVMMNRILMLLLAATLAGCGGGSTEPLASADVSAAPLTAVPPASPASAPSVAPAPPPHAGPASPAASATLSQNAVVLTDPQNARFISRADGTVTYSGALDLAPGAVVIGATDVFKVVSIQVQGGNTVLTVTSPALEEVFDVVKISGTFAATADGVQTAALQPVTVLPLASRLGRQLAAAVSGLFNWLMQIEAGPSTVSEGLSGTVTATVDYDFDKGAGGLRSARLNIDADSQLTARVSLKRSSSAPVVEKQVGSVRIPIPVSLVDRALNVIGVRVASVYVPFYLGADLSAGFDMDFSTTTRLTGGLGMAYAAATGPVLAGEFSATRDDTDFAPTTPGGAPVLASFNSSVGLFLRMRPALAFLDRVAMAGMDGKLSANAATVLQVLPVGSCVTFTPSVEFGANGFFKGVGIEEIRSAGIASTLYKGAERRTGSCLAPTVTDLVLSSPVPAAYGQPLVLRTTVSVDPASRFSVPAAAPTGTVEVRLGAASCTLSLVQQSVASSNGECTLVPLAAGDAVAVSLAYSGNASYSPSAGAATLRIDRAATAIGISSSLNPAMVGASVSFSGSVLPHPVAPGEPTGAIEFLRDGQHLCTATIASAGTGGCSASFSSAGTSSITANYLGDTNFSPSSAAALQQVVGGTVPAAYAGSLSLAGPAAITGTSCIGSLVVDGSAAVNLAGTGASFRLVGTERIQMNCYNQTGPADITVPLTRNADMLTGQVQLPFSCAAPCNSGSVTVTVNAQVTGTGPASTVTGSVIYVNQNQTPFLARATGSFGLTSAP